MKEYSGRSFLFLAETVFVYFIETRGKWLVFKLPDQFPGSELIFDGWRPFEVWLGNRFLSSSQFAGQMNWGCWGGQEIEGWGACINLLDKWAFFDQPEPRLKTFQWMAPLFHWFKPMRIFHFQLGKTKG